MADTEHEPRDATPGRYGRGWGRPDAQVREEIRNRMTGHSYLDASDVQVTVAHGEVTLTGTASDQRARELAGEVAASVSGVRAVQNELELGLSRRMRARIENPEDEDEVA